MASKLSQNKMDEKRDLQKQLGCMNGIFQLFDRRYFLGQQRGSVRNHKRLPPPPGQSGNDEMELKDALEGAMEKDPKKLAKEKQRVSVESSRTSFSSACSSTEPPSSSKSIYPEAPSPIIMIEQPTHIKPLNLRDLVKDSMYREARSVSVKTMKHIDSPRPLQQQKSVQPPRGYGQDKSNRNLPEASWDAPRFSYDGRVSQSKLKSSLKLKELPRLSLDSREKSRKNFIRDTQRSSQASGQIVTVDQEPGSNKRPSGLVAKLMGLDALPDPSTDNDLVATSASSRMGEEVKKSQISGSPRVSYKEATSPRMGIASTATNQPEKSRLPLEPAPWRQGGGRQGLQKPALKTKESSMNTPHASASVYGEIEKRLTELEFKKSGKDLRALKQILEAMEKTRKRLEDTEQSMDLESKSSKCSSDYGSWDQHNHPVSPSVKGNSPTKRGQFPVMVIKPAKFIGKPIISDAKETSGLQKLRTKKFSYEGRSHFGDPSGAPLPSPEKKKNARALGPSLSPKVPENLIGERLTSSRRTSGSGSPRMQQKSQGTEKQYISSNPSEYGRSKKQSIKKPMRSEGATKTMKPKSTNSQHKDEQFNREARNLSQQSDTVSIQSESNSSLASQNDTDVTSRDWTCKISKYAARLREDGSMAELATATTLEQPSPVSVLDAAFYGEESPSPVKKISNAFREYETLTCEDAEWNQEVSTNGWSQFDHDKLENIRQLVDRITLLNSTPKEATTNATSPFHEHRHPDHLYITEIFLASGFLENLGSSNSAIRLHSSGHLIDPNLFHVLEKNKEYTELASYEHQEKSVGTKSSQKDRRKLIFDCVDEILVRKLAFTGSNKMRKSLGGKKLLEEVWSEVNNLQANSDNSMDDEEDELIGIIRADVNKKSADWERQSNELPAMVLDIERLIFKDLISEFVINGVTGSLLDQSVRPCKQLFSL